MMKKFNSKLKKQIKEVKASTVNLKDLPFKVGDLTVPGGIPSLDCNDQNIGVAQTPTPDGLTSTQIVNVEYVNNQNNSFATTAETFGDIFFIFPPTLAENLELLSGTGSQMGLNNNSPTEIINYNFICDFYNPTLGGQPVTYENINDTLGPSSSLGFDNGDSLDLSAIGSYQRLFLSMASANLLVQGYLEAYLRIVDIPDIGTRFQCYGEYGLFGNPL